MKPHGHVTPRPDGFKARCGGVALCGVCQQEAARAPIGSSQCPICGVDSPHTHAAAEIREWNRSREWER
jgi:hypothetical protein